MGHFRTEKRSEIGAMGGMTAVDNGPGVENSRNRCDMEETKTATIEGDKSNRENMKMKKKNKGERVEEKTKIHSSSLGKPLEVVEKPHNRRWLALTLLERRWRVSL
jgi:hypothetical protein